MDNKGLIDRYIYAVTRKLKEADRNDVSMELRGGIEDMIEARAGGGEVTEGMVRDVLREMGKPADLAAKYQTDSDNALIGQPHYELYKLVMPIGLGIVLGSVTLGMVVAFIVSGASASELPGFFGKLIAELFQIGIGLFAWITIIFRILYRVDAKIGTDEDFLDRLPEIPKEDRLIPRSESLWGIALNLLFLGVFFFLIPAAFTLSWNGTLISPFSETALAKSRWFILALGTVGLLREIVRLIEGEKTRLVLVVGIVAAIATMILSYFWLSDPNLLNPGLAQAMVSAGVDAELAGMVKYLPTVVLIAIQFGSVIEIVRCIFGLTGKQAEV